MSLDETLVCMKITLLLLCLWLILFISECPLIWCSQYHSAPEVVIPLRVTGTSRVMRAQGWISYSLYFEGQRYTVHLKVKKLLVFRSFSVFTYNDQGALLQDQPFVQNDCYYNGYVEGDPESLVILSTCSGGFQGLLQLNDVAYVIKPKMFSATFEHLVYKMDNEETSLPRMRCGLTEEEIAQQLMLQVDDNLSLMQSSYKGWWTHRFYIELAVVVDETRFFHCKSNVSNVQKEIFIIFHIMNTYYAPMDIVSVIPAVEIWNKGNPIPIDIISELLDDFCLWKRINFQSRVPHDVVHLFVNRTYGIYLGLTKLGTVCLQNYNCGVNSITGDNYLSMSVIVAHELGHNLGMSHDDPRYCPCGRKTCIMFPYATNSTRFSNCSYSYMWDIVLRRGCTHNIPSQAKNPLTESYCGNGIVEKGEECDCGSLKSCAQDLCCLENCILKPGAACAFGLCCKNCQFMSSGTICRKQVTECDFPEWCNGTSHACPEDEFMVDGTPCLEKGFCYKNKCNDRDEQCRSIFGKDAKSANKNCYLTVNTKGDRFGNCGMKDHLYIRCNDSNMLCGRVQCVNVKEIPSLEDHTTIHWTEVHGLNCWGTDYHWGMKRPDIGEVKDGTECGIKRVCIQKQCVSTSVLNQHCFPHTCNMRGTCNNKHHCHCDFGWAPPDCLHKGTGGSVDSGPPPKKRNFSYLRILMFITLICVWTCIFILLWRRNKKRKTAKKNIQSESMITVPNTPSSSVKGKESVLSTLSKERQSI